MARACTHADTPHVFRTSALGTTADLVVSEGSALVAASELLEVELARSIVSQADSGMTQSSAG